MVRHVAGGGHGQNGLGKTGAGGGWGSRNEIDPDVGNGGRELFTSQAVAAQGWMVEVVNATGRGGGSGQSRPQNRKQWNESGEVG